MRRYHGKPRRGAAGVSRFRSWFSGQKSMFANAQGIEAEILADFASQNPLDWSG
jgi:hypothetical protein